MSEIEHELRNSTPLFGANSTYVAEMYDRYLNDANSVGEEWRELFTQLGDDVDSLLSDFYGGSWANDNKVAAVKARSRIVGAESGEADAESKPAAKSNGAAAPAAAPSAAPSAAGSTAGASDSVHLHQMIRAYRIRGHLLATLDPLGLTQRESHPELDPAHYGFGEADMDREMFVDGWMGYEKATLRQVLDALKETYCGNFAVEYAHITSLEQKEWLESRIEKSRGKPSLTDQQRRNILEAIVEVQGFEEFLQLKYPGTKRFSIEGAENTIPAMETILERGADLGVREIVLGMPHRGRLNTLTAFMGKAYSAMLSEFQGNLAHPEHLEISGDVKYHLGTSSDREPNGNKVHLSLTANPSHLEAVNPVVVGKVRAKQDQRGDAARKEVMGLLLHGDAAFAGQGVVAETLALGDLVDYTTGGTVHIIVNNQIGFTTAPHKARKSPYPTDVAKIIQAPIFHANGDDPEAVIHAATLAAEFRQEFQKDVVIDIICYRRHGHNEGDEPMFTQPLMYKAIKAHKTPRDVYAERLIAEKVITPEEYEASKQRFHDFLEGEKETADNYAPDKADWLEGKWQGFKKPEKGVKADVETGVKLEKLKEVGAKLTTAPDGVALNSKIERLLKQRREMVDSGEGLDWGMAEHLAFGTLLDEGFPIRMSGQDVGRGTFSQRHALLLDQNSGDGHMPLRDINPNLQVELIDSNLSEFAVLGFEYGYSLAEPNSLTLWEGQFGDFVNGAQIMIDQFITSAETKWLRMSGLVMLLPHGYEGQGPEHSSGRLERFLGACAEDNIQVANCTTPANYFHILRRQLVRDFRKPLIIMTPKSLLRHKLAQSTLEEMRGGTTFKRVIEEIDALRADDQIKRAVICSGKVYYDLLQARRDQNIDDVAILRLEQFYPFPALDLAKELSRYPNADVVWCQEEPRNMGGWHFVDRRIEETLQEINRNDRPIYAGRKDGASPAEGYMKLHKVNQDKLVNEALGGG